MSTDELILNLTCSISPDMEQEEQITNHESPITIPKEYR